MMTNVSWATSHLNFSRSLLRWWPLRRILVSRQIRRLEKVFYLRLTHLEADAGRLKQCPDGNVAAQKRVF